MMITIIMKIMIGPRPLGARLRQLRPGADAQPPVGAQAADPELPACTILFSLSIYIYIYIHISDYYYSIV